jgi:uncharacterized protein (TIGR02757 family)
LSSNNLRIVSAQLTTRQRNRAREIAPFLETIYRHYHRPELLATDPVTAAWEWTKPNDQELVALLAALLAYGQVRQVLVSLEKALVCLDGAPSEVVAAENLEQLIARFQSWRHRVTSGESLALLLWLVGQARQNSRGLGAEFCHPIDTPTKPGQTQERNALSALLRWHQNLVRPAIHSPALHPRVHRRDFRHLLPNPQGPSASKRLWLFLRWMVRPNDGIDLGLWNPDKTEGLSGCRGACASSFRSAVSSPCIPALAPPERPAVTPHPDGIPVEPADLLMPVDTHILRIGQNLGLLPPRSKPNLASALHLTRMLRIVDPKDPVRFDFAICRMGILQTCPTKESLLSCKACELQPRCQRYQKMIKKD